MLTGPSGRAEQSLLRWLSGSLWTTSCETLWPKLSWRHRNPQFQTLLQSYSKQNSMVLAQKEHGSMEQNQQMIKDINETIELFKKKSF